MRCNIFALAAMAPSALAGPFRPHDVVRRANVTTLAPVSDLPPEWAYKGCYSDMIRNRVLDEGFFASRSNMTGESCINYCGGLGFSYAGTEFSRECFCGVGLKNSSMPTPNDCDMPCTGNSSQACGGPNRLTVYANDIYPVTNPGANGFVSLGCWADNVNNRTLPYEVQVPGGCKNMSVAACTSVCRGFGFSLAGVEYSGECFCGLDLDYAGSVAGDPSDSGCEQLCQGNRTEFCGGPNRLNMYIYVPPKSSSSSSMASSSTPLSSSSVPVTTTTETIMTSSSSSEVSSSTPVSSSVVITTTDTSTVPASTSSEISSSTPVVNSTSVVTTTETSMVPSSSSEISSSAPYVNSTSVITTTETSTVPRSSSSDLSSSTPVANTTSSSEVLTSTLISTITETSTVPANTSSELSSSTPFVNSTSTVTETSTVPANTTASSTDLSTSTVTETSTTPANTTAPASSTVESSSASFANSTSTVIETTTAPANSTVPASSTPAGNTTTSTDTVTTTTTSVTVITQTDVDDDGYGDGDDYSGEPTIQMVDLKAYGEKYGNHAFE